MNTFKDSSNFENGLTATTISSPTIDGKQDTLVSGTNIKTINGESLLGDTDIVIVADSSDKVAKTGDTMTGQLNIDNNLNIGTGNTFTSTDSAGTISNGIYAFTQGEGCTASGINSHAEGAGTIASGINSHAEGGATIASGNNSHAEGIQTIANGQTSHAEGIQTTASGEYSHAEGISTKASGEYSHAEGVVTIASGEASHAEGFATIANNVAEHASGLYNVSISGTNQILTALIKDSQATLFSIGNGNSESTRKNAFEVKYNGDIYLNLNGTIVKLQDLLSKIVI